jgi:large subunit ribosomal protein L9
VNMKVILREDVPALGKAGDVVEVKRGFGRNYLVPQKKAVLATSANIRHLDHEKAVALAGKAKLRARAAGDAEKLNQVQITIARRVGEQDKLYGSVTAMDIAEVLAAQGNPVDRHKIHLPEPIKSLGEFEVEIRLHADVTSKIKLLVIAQQ